MILDGRALTRLEERSILIVDSTQVSGLYYVEPATRQNNYDPGVVAIDPPPGAVMIIKVGHEAAGESFEIIDSANFSGQYKSNSWLRKKLAAEGLYSVEEALGGRPVYKPDKTGMRYKDHKHYISKTVGDTVYYDDSHNATIKQKAYSFAVVDTEVSGPYRLREYYSDNGKLAMEGHCTSLCWGSYTGLFTSYYHSGNVSSRGTFTDNRESGEWQFYHDTLSGVQWYKCSYTNGVMDGMLTSYYPDGKVKREEMHKARPKPEQRSQLALEDTVINGRCFDQTGVEIAYTPFQEMPEPSFNINQFLSSHIKYPRQARFNEIEGRVVARFSINKEGKVGDIYITETVSKLLDEEVVRVIAKMPRWIPGKVDDEVTDTYFTLPVSFQLE